MATLCRFLSAVPVPAVTRDGQLALTAEALQQLQTNLQALTADRTAAEGALHRLPADTKAMVVDLMRQGLMAASEVLGILQPDGTPPAHPADANQKLIQGMARLVQERLGLTAPDTFQPPIGQADGQGSRWQPQQITAIAHTVLQGLRDGMAGHWENLHFRLEVPQMPDGAKLLDRDIGAMRYGHFDQGFPGQPPTMVLSALDNNPQASAAVQNAWKDLWSEISTGQHYLGNGDPTAHTMASMLQGYLQEQQIDAISQKQRPIERALALNVERTAEHGKGAEQDFAARLLTSSSGLRSDAIADLWAMHQLLQTAQDDRVPGPERDEALRHLRDFLGTVNRTGPQAEMIRHYLGAELVRLGPAKVDDWLAGTDGRSRRQTERVVVKEGANLPKLLVQAGGGRGPEAILQFLRLNKDLKGVQAITVNVPDDHATKLGLTGKRVNGMLTYSPTEFVALIEADRKLLDGLQARHGLQRGPGADPGRKLTISVAEARRIGHFANGFPNTQITAQRLWELVQLAQSRSDEAVRFSRVNLRAGTTVEMPPRTWNFSPHATRQMAIDTVDARSQMLAFVSRRMQNELLDTPRVNRTLATDIQNLQRVDTPLQEDGRFGQQTQRAMQRLERESGMQNGFDPTTWYRHMLRTAMPTTHEKQNYWVALTTHEMVGHGSEEGLISAYAEPLAATLGSTEAYAQTFQFWGYGVFGFLDGQGEPPRPGDADALMNDPRTVAAHATIGTESLADGMYTFNPGAGFITPYAKSSPAEAWAESMRFFTQRPERLLRESPAAFLFINAVTERFTSDQIMALAATAGVFGSETAAKARLGQAIDQLSNVRHPSINPAVVRQFATQATTQALQGLIRGDMAPAGVREPARPAAASVTVIPTGAQVMGPEQRAMQQLLQDPGKTAIWAETAAGLQPFGEDPDLADNPALLENARQALTAVGLSPTDVAAIPDRTLLRWLAEADDMVAMAHVRQMAEQASMPGAQPTDKLALKHLLDGLWQTDGKHPQDVFPAGVWQRTSPEMQRRLSDVGFLGDLRNPQQPAPHGTYQLLMTRPGDLVGELGQVRLASRKDGLDRLQNQVQTIMWTMIDSSVDRQQGAASIGKLIPQIRADLADQPRLTAAYRTYLDQLEKTLHHYGNGGTNPPPAGLLELYDFTTDGLAVALEHIGVLRLQLGLTSAPSGQTETKSSAAH
jgi:hypothetical protein